MTNNINNVNFNAVNFNGNEKNTASKADKCNCETCKQAEASSLEALAAIRQADVKGPYKFDPKNVEKDVKEFEAAWARYADEALDAEFKSINDIIKENEEEE